jgi:hypothetical protein
MSRPVSDIKNLGPASVEAFARAGITTAEEIEAMGADEAYRRLLRAGSPPHFIGYYVLVMGLQGRPWNDCRDAEKAALRRRFDAIKAEFKANPGEVAGAKRFEAVMNEIGLVQPGRGGR